MVTNALAKPSTGELVAFGAEAELPFHPAALVHAAVAPRLATAASALVTGIVAA